MLVPLGFCAWRMLRRGRRRGVKFPAMGDLPRRGVSWRAAASAAAPYAYLAALALLVVAAARPRSSYGTSARSVDAIAIAMAVDVSGSMEVLDLTPREDWGKAWKTRLDVVKEIFAKFVEARPDDLIGLVTFGGYAATRTPLTADHPALLAVLKGVEIPSARYDANGMQVDGEETLTAIGDGLATAVARVEAAPVKSRIVILLSDGVQTVQNAVEPAEAAKAAAALGVKVYTIGVGTKSSKAPFKVKDRLGRDTIAYANMTFDESQLKSIATTTGGRYFPVNDTEALAAALAEIDQLEKTTVDTTAHERWHEYFVPFLFAGAMLAFAAASIQMAASRRIA